MNCNSNHSLFLRSNGTLVCWDDHGSLKELQSFDPALNYATDVYLGPVYENIRNRLRAGVMPFPDYCSNCFCLMTHVPMDDGRHVRERTIETFQIEPSMGCQLECPGCIKKSDRRGRVARTPFGHMTLKPEILHKIVLDLKDAGVKVGKFDFQGHGEPLLNKEIWDMCGFLAEHYPGSIISICTHANADFRSFMVKSGVNEILFSIDGVDQRSYDPWRVHGKFNTAYRFMRNFSREAADDVPHIRRIWKYVLFSHNDSDAQLLRAQELALDAKITTLRFVVTQLGPASTRIFSREQIPCLDASLDIVVDNYRIDIAQLTSGLRALRAAISERNIGAAQSWADFLATSLHRLFSTRLEAGLAHQNIVEAFLESTAPLPADLFRKYDEMMVRSIPSIAGWLSRQESSASKLNPLTDALVRRKHTPNPMPKPPRRATVSEVRSSIAGVDVDEVWYLDVYPDVRAAVSRGDFSSATHHYRAVGYSEGRLPAEPTVNIPFYLARYPDLASARDRGLLPDPVKHFTHFGYREGRSPSS